MSEEQEERTLPEMYVRNEEVVRSPDGKFVKGVSGNPKGRPKGKRNRITELNEDMELAIREGANPEVVKSIIASMAAEAMNGNVQAAKLILDKFVPNVRSSEASEATMPEIVIKIENLTKEDLRDVPGEVITQEVPENGNEEPDS